MKDQNCIKLINKICCFLMSLVAMVACNQNDKKQFDVIRSSESGIDFVNKVVDNSDANILDYPYFSFGNRGRIISSNNIRLTTFFKPLYF